jgi:tetratricopeptide (TPR) repeat protein
MTVSMKDSSKARIGGSGASSSEDSLPSASVEVGSPRRRRRGILTIGLLILAAEAAYLCNGAWQQTRLREAYLPQLKEMAARQPSDGPLQVVLACRLALARQYREASQVFEHGVRDGEGPSEVWLAWAASAAAGGDKRTAWTVLTEGQRDPRLAPALRAAVDHTSSLPANTSPGQLAATLYPQGLPSLLARYTRGSFLNGLISWYGHLHPSVSGVATRERWAKEQPNSARAQLLWSDALLRNEEYAEAESAFRHTLTLMPQSPSAQLGLADTLYHQGRITEAARLYGVCHRKDPSSLRALLGMGQIALDKHLLAMGVDIFNKAVKLAPDSADAWIGLGKAYYNQSLDIGHALDAYARAVKLAPDRTDFYPDYANVLRVNSQFADAESYLRKRLAVAPNEAPTHYYLAVALLSSNITPQRQADAEAHLRTSLQLEPRGYEASSHLGRLLVDERRFSEAMPYLDAALQIDRNDLPTMIALVRALRGLGRATDAKAAQARVVALSGFSRQIKDLEDALQRQPTNPALYQQMAKVYITEGEPDKARNYSDAAMMLVKYPERAKRGLTTLEKSTATTIPDLGTSKSPHGSP